MQKRDMAGIDSAFHGLQPIRLLNALRYEALLGRNQRELPFGKLRLLIGRTHIGPQHAAAFEQRIRLKLDLFAVAAFAWLGWHVNALACVIIFPAVISAAQAALFIAAKPQRYASMGAKFVDQAEPALAVAKRYQALGQ